MIFWRVFETHWGPGGERPASYWQPWLAQCFVTIDNIGDLTPYQLDACREQVTGG